VPVAAVARMMYRLGTIVLSIALIVLMITRRLWLVLAVAVGMAVALLALDVHDRRAVARLARAELRHDEGLDE
jgi:hypothetical protein